jgi:hypothetical protein
MPAMRLHAFGRSLDAVAGPQFLDLFGQLGKTRRRVVRLRSRSGQP